MEPILLLHGAVGASIQISVVAERLSKEYKVYLPCFNGHGGKPMPEGPFSIELFANEVLQLIENEQLKKVSVFGYSMGGYVGMYLARNYPEKINKVITLATKYYWDPVIAAKEIKMLDAATIEQKVPAFAEVLRSLHEPNDWKQVLVKTAEMMQALGIYSPLQQADYPVITAPVLLLIGDRDKMVTLEETLTVFKLLPNGQMGILPNTPHPIEKIDTSLLSFLVMRFLQS